MDKIHLRKIKTSDKECFSRWWRDKELLKLTSGVLNIISDEEVERYFKNILNNKIDFHFMITVGGIPVGHISLIKRLNNWYETQIIIGEKKYRGKGYGSKAIKLLIKKAELFNISKIYLEVRPTNIRAIHTYECCGFQKIKTVSYPQNKHLQETLRMELK